MQRFPFKGEHDVSIDGNIRGTQPRYSKRKFVPEKIAKEPRVCSTSTILSYIEQVYHSVSTSNPIESLPIQQISTQDKVNFALQQF